MCRVRSESWCGLRRCSYCRDGWGEMRSDSSSRGAITSGVKTRRSEGELEPQRGKTVVTQTVVSCPASAPEPNSYYTTSSMNIFFFQNHTLIIIYTSHLYQLNTKSIRKMRFFLGFFSYRCCVEECVNFWHATVIRRDRVTVYH